MNLDNVKQLPAPSVYVQRISDYSPKTPPYVMLVFQGRNQTKAVSWGHDKEVFKMKQYPFPKKWNHLFSKMAKRKKSNSKYNPQPRDYWRVWLVLSLMKISLQD